MWEASDPYLYMRATADQRILVGGEDAKTADPKKRDALIPEKALALMRKLKKLLPGRDFTALPSSTRGLALSRTAPLGYHLLAKSMDYRTAWQSSVAVETASHSA